MTGGFRWSSLQDLFAIQEKMNRLFEETIHRTEFPDEGLDAALWSPASDVYETAEEVVLSVELPGVQLEDVHLESLDGKLRVSGVRRDFSIPASIDSSRIKATLKSGILRVVAPKADRAHPIPVETKKTR